MAEQEGVKLGHVVVGRDAEDLRAFGTRGTICFGKHLVGEGEEAHLTTPMLLDVLRPHVIVLCGKRGEGKSYSLGILSEELMKLPEDVRRNLCGLMIDTQGIFWTMKFPNEKETGLAEWGLKPSGFDVSVYVPEGQKEFFVNSDVEFDGVFSASPDELSADEWLSVFELDRNSPLGILLQRVVGKIGARKSGYTISDIIDAVKEEKGFENEKLALENRFEAAKTWGIFGESKMPDILESGKVTVIDVSLTPQNVRALLVSLVGRKIFAERTMARRKEEIAETEGIYVKRTPLCWILIDEAHNFVPDDKIVASSETLLKIVREGRQPGITVVAATQQPNKLHPDVLAQCDMVISHRLTSKADIDALRAIMQTYMLYDIAKYINELPKLKGVVIILDDNSERLYTARVRLRQSWHAGSSPLAV
ncbi:MAG: ATP-binding protein [Candidatus Aenigmarchaeota archaeon]|nr:ATP-binding protein [Candidatus Aenigmarchaeota archaeon]